MTISTFTELSLLLDNESTSSFAGLTINTPITDLNLSGYNFHATDFWASPIQNCNFQGANFDKATLEGCEIKHCDFFQCDLSETNMERCKFTACSFNNTPLRNASFRHAWFYGCNFEFCPDALTVSTGAYGLVLYRDRHGITFTSGCRRSMTIDAAIAHYQPHEQMSWSDTTPEYGYRQLRNVYHLIEQAESLGWAI